jgi:hypothetical protein
MVASSWRLTRNASRRVLVTGAVGEQFRIEGRVG